MPIIRQPGSIDMATSIESMVPARMLLSMTMKLSSEPPSGHAPMSA